MLALYLLSILRQLPINSASYLVKATRNQTKGYQGAWSPGRKAGRRRVKNGSRMMSVKQRDTTQHVDVKTTETTFLQLGAFFSAVSVPPPTPRRLWIAPFWCCCCDMHIVKYWGKVNEGTLEIHLISYKACTLKRYQQVWHNIYKSPYSPRRTSGSLKMNCTTG